MSAKYKKGFTLIELLIVIAVLGILAVAVLSAINPIEMINRSRDTGSRSDSEQFLGAIDRYYASRGFYPWMSGEQSTNDDLDWTEITATAQTFGLDAEPVLSNLVEETGELKATFTDRITDATANHLFIFKGAGDNDSAYVCFKPKSKSFADEAYARCTGTPPTDFPTASACNNTTECGSQGACSCLP